MQNTLNQVFCLVMSTDSSTFLHSFNSAHFFYKLHEVMEGPLTLRDLTGQCSFSYENKRMHSNPSGRPIGPKMKSAQHARLPV